MQTEQTRPRASRLWPIAAVFMTIIIAGVIVALYSMYQCTQVPQKFVTTLGDAFRPNTTYKTEIHSAISGLKSNPKLVVLTATIDAEVKKSASTTALWIYWGTTTVQVRARENKVQFYIPFDELTADNFRYDHVHKTLTLTVKPPVLDEDVVDVQTDPEKIEQFTSNGWAKLDRWSGAPMREDARRELRNAVLQSAKNPTQYDLLQLKAKENAKESVKKLLTPLTKSLKAETRVEIEFER